eukprot:gnl/TRDRNA2_/TRDRNA2_152167_c0_seq1.p1 gnl/TRDRNA2_/TRDRNA2_152167_c0~~gnl/TRDRNA2_/TRDRNA2_152167_c0_seq1.p1  ORF type:complete len:1036 (+),score=202.39 gnl/TRDRNA2_/TRDRNA2_152167_c0_seq1:62-3169(+)
MSTTSAADGVLLDRLTRARCLVPLLGHVAVRLASMAPVLQLLRDAARRGGAPVAQWGDDGDIPSEPERPDMPEAHEARLAVEEVLSRAEGVGRFAAELAELCCADGQWLAILALAPRVVEKVADDYARLAAAIDELVSRLAGTPPPSGNSGAGVSGGASRVGGGILEAGQAAALCSLLATVSGDLKADLRADEAPGSARLGPELAVARALQRRLLPRAAGLCGGLKASSAEDAAADGIGCAAESEEALLARLALLGGGSGGAGADKPAGRPTAALKRELEAAESYCRVLDGTAAPPPSARGAEAQPRLQPGNRNALVSETQASGGSALHRWIRAQVVEPQRPGRPSGAAGVAGGTTAAGGTRGSGTRQPFLTLADVPHEFLCPITHDVMRDAVSTADGHTYERRNIEAWLAENSTSPVTGLPLANKTLIPNHNLRKLILDSGVLSRLEPDAKPDTEGTRFRGEVCCEIAVPRDAPTLVDALAKGAERAVARGSRAPPGRTPPFGVRLLAGEHAVPESVQLDQEVEVIGSGASTTILRLAAGAYLEFRTAARLANVTVCRDVSSGPGNGTLGDRNASTPGLPRVAGSARVPALVEVTQGSCRIEQCDLSNAAGSAIRVSGAHTSPTISHNVIHGCLDTGVVFKDGADGTLASNRLFGHCSVAIEVHSRADPLIEDNDVFDGQQGGVFVYSRGKGHLRRNKIFRNALEGVEIKQGGRPLVEDNDIYDNLECGIFIHEGGEGRVIGNRIHSNSYAGIEIKDASSPEVRANDVYSGRTSGMYVHSGANGVIEGNKIHQNWLHGVYVRDKGCPRLLKNHIFRNDECGIFITENSHPCVEHNEVYMNGLAGIEVKEGSNPTIKLNRIHEGNTGGIFVLCRGRGRIFENKLYKNKLEGIEIKDGGDPQVTNNEICENLECGVFAHDGALGRIEDNRIFANAYAGIEIKDMSNTLVKNNKIYRGSTSGVYVHSGGRGKVEGNHIFQNGLHGVMILSGGCPLMSGNQVYDNTECGVVAHVGYALDTVANNIYQNHIRDVQVVNS